MAASQQQALWADTIVGMKRALAREDDASESDSSIKVVTNRSNKLKRKAKYVQEGHLGLADGPRVYRRKIRYNDYDRYIISRKPQKMDVDGDLLDVEESHTDEDLTDAEEDPYKDVKIEYLLRPLTRAADLDKHPTLSLPYKSKSLDELIQHAEETLQRERNALWRLKTLFTEFQGDATFMPTGEFESDQDIYMFNAPATRQASVPAPSSIPDLEPGQQPPGAWDAATEETVDMSRTDDENIEMRDAYEGLAKPGAVDVADGINGAANISSTSAQIEEINDAVDAAALKSKELSEADPDTATQEAPPDTIPKPDEPGDGQKDGEGEERRPSLLEPEAVHANGTTDIQPTTESEPTALEMQEPSTTIATDHALGALAASASASLPLVPDGILPNEALGIPDNDNHENQDKDNDNNEADNDAESTHRMTTRRRAANTTPPPHSPISPVPQGSSPAPSSAIHPFFAAPPRRHAARYFGLLNGGTARDTLMLLNIYLQKQEDVVRTCGALHNELLKAARLKEDVYRWCRAEGHVGELSDGEDWVDAEQWGFEFAEGETLKKGEEVDDEEQVVGTGKKTRQRRAAREG